MSLIFKCDVCGKDSAMTGVDFSNGPLFVRKTNYEGKVVRIFLNMMIEDEDDFKRLLEAKKQISKMKEIFTSEDDEDEDILELESDSFSIELENPYPMMCNQCKKIVAQDLLNDAEFPVEKKSYSSSSKRIADLSKILSDDN